MLAGEEPAAALLAARETIMAAFVAVPRDAEARAGWEAALGELLKDLGGKIAPGMPAEAADRWCGVMIKALSDLPAMIALTAAKRAIHQPMQFLNEVETAIRNIAAVVVRERKNALGRLEALERELRAASQSALPAPAVEPMTQEEIDALPVSMRRAGLRFGALTEEQAKLPPGDPAGVQRAVTAADYEALGLSAEEAAQALSDREKLLKRGQTPPIGDLLDGIVDDRDAA